MTRKMLHGHGFASIGLYMPKSPENVGSVLRAAACYNVSMVAAQGQRYRKAPTDTIEAWREIPFLQTDDLMSVIPFGTVPVAVEFIKSAKPLTTYQHPERAFYVFGPEDGSVPNHILDRCRDVVYIPTEACMNLAATVNVLLYDRMLKSQREAA
jgi:tRNA(Leu) C34 or U34 (ribose-2'-O)-methylase TrmL